MAVRGAVRPERRRAHLTAQEIRYSFLKKPTGRMNKSELGWKASPRHPGKF